MSRIACPLGLALICNKKSFECGIVVPILRHCYVCAFLFPSQLLYLGKNFTEAFIQEIHLSFSVLLPDLFVKLTDTANGR